MIGFFAYVALHVALTAQVDSRKIRMCPESGKEGEMSKFIPTKVGLFRHWKAKDGTQGFLLQCHECGEWLPMNEATLAGELSFVHEVRREGRYCSFTGPFLFGPDLVATMQARLLIDGRAWEDNERVAKEETRIAGGAIFCGA